MMDTNHIKSKMEQNSSSSEAALSCFSTCSEQGKIPASSLAEETFLYWNKSFFTINNQLMCFFSAYRLLRRFPAIQWVCIFCILPPKQISSVKYQSSGRHPCRAMIHPIWSWMGSELLWDLTYLRLYKGLTSLELLQKNIQGSSFGLVKRYIRQRQAGLA